LHLRLGGLWRLRLLLPRRRQLSWARRLLLPRWRQLSRARRRCARGLSEGRRGGEQGDGNGEPELHENLPE
jgi:hypothetical protein